MVKFEQRQAADKVAALAEEEAAAATVVAMTRTAEESKCATANAVAVAKNELMFKLALKQEDALREAKDTLRTHLGHIRAHLGHT